MNDILLDKNYDLAISPLGDLAVGVSDSQQAQLLLLSAPGEWKEHPTKGVGMHNFLEHHNSGHLARRVHEVLTADGMRVDKISIDDNKIDIQASYDNQNNL